MEIAGLKGIVDGVNSSTIIEELVVNSHVVIEVVELAVTPLLHVHLGDPVVGEVERDVATEERFKHSWSGGEYIPGTRTLLETVEGLVLVEAGGPDDCVNVSRLSVTREHYGGW